MKINFITFGLKYHHLGNIDFQIDARILPNPFYEDNLKMKTGLDDDVYDYVLKSEKGEIFKGKIIDYLDFYIKEISFHEEITIGVCCTGGQHRSVAVARFLYNYYKGKYECSLEHMESDKWVVNNG